MTDHDHGYEAAVNALGLLTATHHDGTLSGPITMAYLAEVAPDRRYVVRPGSRWHVQSGHISPVPSPGLY